MAASLYGEGLTLHRLRVAFAEANPLAGPGVDGVTAMAFERGARVTIPLIRQRLLRGTYRHEPYRVRRIPKPGGGRRMLSEPCQIDRVVQSAYHPTLARVVEPALHPMMYAYRPGRRIDQAVRDVVRAVGRDGPFGASVDEETAFDMVPTGPVGDLLLRRTRGDARFCGFVMDCMTPGRIDGGEYVPHEGRGLAQGAVFAPTLFNLAMAPIAWTLVAESVWFLNFSDNWLLLAPTAEACCRSVALLDAELERLYGMRLKPATTRVVDLRQERLDFLGVEIGADGARVPARRVAAFEAALREAESLRDRRAWPEFHRAMRSVAAGIRHYRAVAPDDASLTAMERRLRALSEGDQCESPPGPEVAQGRVTRSPRSGEPSTEPPGSAPDSENPTRATAEQDECDRDPGVGRPDLPGSFAQRGAIQSPSEQADSRSCSPADTDTSNCGGGQPPAGGEVALPAEAGRFLNFPLPKELDFLHVQANGMIQREMASGGGMTGSAAWSLACLCMDAVTWLPGRRRRSVRTDLWTPIDRHDVLEKLKVAIAIRWFEGRGASLKRPTVAHYEVCGYRRAAARAFRTDQCRRRGQVVHRQVFVPMDGGMVQNLEAFFARLGDATQWSAPSRLYCLVCIIYLVQRLGRLGRVERERLLDCVRQTFGIGLLVHRGGRILYGKCGPDQMRRDRRLWREDRLDVRSRRLVALS